MATTYCTAPIRNNPGYQALDMAKAISRAVLGKFIWSRSIGGTYTVYSAKLHIAWDVAPGGIVTVRYPTKATADAPAQRDSTPTAFQVAEGKRIKFVVGA